MVSVAKLFIKLDILCFYILNIAPIFPEDKLTLFHSSSMPSSIFSIHPQKSFFQLLSETNYLTIPPYIFTADCIFPEGLLQFLAAFSNIYFPSSTIYFYISSVLSQLRSLLLLLMLLAT